VSEFWCADFTKWAWKKAGVTGGLGTLTPAAASFYTWGTEHEVVPSLVELRVAAPLIIRLP